MLFFQIIKDENLNAFNEFIDQLSSKEISSLLVIRDSVSGFTPLQIACEVGNLPIVKKLCELGANVNVDIEKDLIFQPNNYRYVSPAALACANGHLNIVVYLIQTANAVFEVSIENKSFATGKSLKQKDRQTVFYSLDDSFSSLFSLLFPCAIHGHENIVEYLVSRGANIRFSNGKVYPNVINTSILASKFNRVTVLQTLMQNGYGFFVDLNRLPHLEMLSAANSGCVEVLDYFLQNRIQNGLLRDSNNVDLFGKYVEAALLEFRQDVANYLIDSLPDFERCCEVIVAALDFSTPTLLQRLLDHKSTLSLKSCILDNLFRNFRASPHSDHYIENLEILLRFCDYDGSEFSPYWISKMTLPTLQFLIKYNIFLPTMVDGYTVLHGAASNKYETERFQILQFLLSNKEVKKLVNKCSLDGHTPLAYAVLSNDVAIVKLLIEHGAKANTRQTVVSKSAIQCVISNSNKEISLQILEVLLQAGAKTSDKDVVYAIKMNNLDVLKVLMRIRTPRKQPSKIFDSLIHTAFLKSESTKHEIAKYILENMDVNVNVEEDGKTLLHLAAERNDSKFVDLLLSKGADIRKCDKYGRTVLTWAVCNDALRSVISLLNHDSNLATKRTIIPIEHVHINVLFRSWKDLYGMKSPDIEGNLAAFIKLAELTTNKRAVWEALNRIVHERYVRIIETEEIFNYVYEPDDIFVQHIDHDIEYSSARVNESERPTLDAFGELARRLIYHHIAEIGNVGETQSISYWTKKIIRECNWVKLRYAARYWGIRSSIPIEVFVMIAKFCDPEWKYEVKVISESKKIPIKKFSGVNWDNN